MSGSSLSSHHALWDLPRQKSGDLSQCVHGSTHLLDDFGQIPAPGLTQLDHLLSKDPTMLRVYLAYSPHATVFLIVTLSLPRFMRFALPSDLHPPTTPASALVFSSLQNYK